MMNNLTVEDFAKTIAHIESIPTVRERFVPTRYPYTYAYDYLKTHADEFGLPRWMCRADYAAILRGNDDKDAICTMLADAYLREWGISKPEETVNET